MSFFAAGGFVMVPVLVLGGAALALALRHLFVPTERSAAAAATARQTLAFAAVAGSALDLWAVGQAVASGAFEAASVPEVAIVGGGEAMAPMAMGLAFAALSALLATLGDTRRAAVAAA
jgi:hypothetical protein